MGRTDRLVDFPDAFADLCAKVIKPALRDVMKHNNPGWLGVRDAPGKTDPDPNKFSTFNRQVSLQIKNFAELSFVAWNPDVKVVRRRNGEDDEDLGLYPLHEITRQLVENIAAQFLASLRR